VPPLAQGVVPHAHEPPRTLEAGASQQYMSVHDCVVIDKTVWPHSQLQSVWSFSDGKEQT
jgi:hypothetical protein